MVSRSTFSLSLSCDHKVTTGAITSRRHTRRANFFMKELLGEISNRRLYRASSAGERRLCNVGSSPRAKCTDRWRIELVAFTGTAFFVALEKNVPRTRVPENIEPRVA